MSLSYKIVELITKIEEKKHKGKISRETKIKINNMLIDATYISPFFWVIALIFTIISSLFGGNETLSAIVFIASTVGCLIMQRFIENLYEAWKSYHKIPTIWLHNSTN